MQDFIRMLAPGGYAVFQAAGNYVPPTDVKLPSGAHQAWLELDQSIPKMFAGEPSHLFVKLVNTSPHPWHEQAKLFVRNHWLAPSGEELVHDDGHGSVDASVDPDQALYVRVGVTCPAEPGRYILELDAVEETVCWFAEHGSPTLRLPVTVLPPRASADRAGDRKAESAASPAPYTTYPWPPDRVIAAIAAAGGRVEVMPDPLGASGSEWESYWYFATKP